MHDCVLFQCHNEQISAFCSQDAAESTQKFHFRAPHVDSEAANADLGGPMRAGGEVDQNRGLILIEYESPQCAVHNVHV